MTSLITGDKFKELCDIECKGSSIEWLRGVVDRTGIHGDSHYYLFTEGHNLKKALWHCTKMGNKEFTVISGNSDANVLDHPGRDFDFHFIESEIPVNVRMIYCQNLNVLSSRARPIPIGVENEKWHKKQKWIELESMIPQDHPRDKWLYVNHAIATNHKERYEPYCLFDKKDWATTKGKVSYLEYLTDLKQHKFRICPFGNGAATHSTWESLYMKNIPIMKKAVFTEMFSRIMPIVLVDNWADVTLEFLKIKWNELKDTEYEYDCLNFEFWKDVIKGKITIQ